MVKIGETVTADGTFSQEISSWVLAIAFPIGILAIAYVVMVFKKEVWDKEGLPPKKPKKDRSQRKRL